jgi:acyl-CoA reductase-like NAD-dependent aldehyde dehydrogenase
LKFLKQQVENIKIGHPLEEGTRMGPVVNKAQYEKVWCRVYLSLL